MRVVVVGGGIAGLTCAWALRHGPAEDPRRRDDLDVVVVEEAARPGGTLDTATIADEPVDVGAESFLARRPEADRLARRLGLANRLVEPAGSGVWLWRDDRLVPYPSGTVFGVPTDTAVLARGGAVGPASVARVVGESLRPRDPVHADVSVADALAPRLGREVVDVLVEPLLGGVYAGSVDRLSVRSATAVLAEMATTPAPLTTAARRRRRAAAAVSGPVFRTVVGGLGRIVDSLAAGLDVRTSTKAVALAAADGGWVVDTTEGPLPADRVVLAVPAQPAAQLLHPVAPVSATALRAVPYASVAVVATVWPADAVTLPRGSGMLVPRGEGRLVKAATWSSSKWAHVGVDGRVVVRFSTGRVDDRRAAMLDDRILAELVLAEGREALGLRGEPIDLLVRRWPDGLPQYDVGHARRVGAVLQGLPSGVHVTGALYDGIGVAPIVGHAQRVAATIRAGG